MLKLASVIGFGLMAALLTGSATAEQMSNSDPGLARAESFSECYERQKARGAVKPRKISKRCSKPRSGKKKEKS